MKEQREALKGTGVAILGEGPERSTAERSEAGRSEAGRSEAGRSEAGRSEGPSSKIAATSSGGASPGGSSSVPSPEVSDKPRRRGFTVEYKLSVLKKADACTKPGELGTLLRREGLYSSTLWGGVVSDARAPWPLCAQRKGVGRQTRSIPWLRVSRSSSMRFAGSNKSSTMPRPSSTSKKNSPRCWGSQ